MTSKLMNFDVEPDVYSNNGRIRARVAEKFNLLDDNKVNMVLYNLFTNFYSYEYSVDKIVAFFKFMGDESVTEDEIKKALSDAVRRGAFYSVIRIVGNRRNSTRTRHYGVILA